MVVRYDISHEEGQRDLKIYEKAIGIMKGDIDLPPAVLDSEMESVLDSDGDGILDRDSPFTLDNQADVHRYYCAHRNQHFLPWHRLYLHYFEEAIRAVTGEEEFALPYWNYNNESTSSIPEQFRDPDSPLYHDRSSSLNDGSQSLQSRGDANYDESSSLYLDSFFYSNFNRGIEFAPHDMVHVEVGKADKVDSPGFDMLDPAVAARDPVFWVHHNNIDRLWSKYGSFYLDADTLEGWGPPKGYRFTNADGTPTGDLLDQPEELMDLIFPDNLYYQDTTDSGAEFLHSPSQFRNLDNDFQGEFSDSTDDFVVSNPDAVKALKPVQVFKERVNVKIGDLDDGDLLINHSENWKAVKNDQKRVIMELKFRESVKDSAIIDVFYSDDLNRGKDPIPDEPKSIDHLVNRLKGKFVSKFKIGGLVFFRGGSSDSQHDHHHSGKKTTDTIMFDITEQLVNQKNKKGTDDRVSFNVRPENPNVNELDDIMIKSLVISHVDL